MSYVHPITAHPIANEFPEFEREDFEALKAVGTPLVAGLGILLYLTWKMMLCVLFGVTCP